MNVLHLGCCQLLKKVHHHGVSQHEKHCYVTAAAGKVKDQSPPEDEEEHSVFPGDRLMDEEEDYDPEEMPVISNLRYGSLPPGHPTGDPELLAVRFRRTGSERLRDGAKALLRRMESLKSRRRRQQNREGVVISGPQVRFLKPGQVYRTFRIISGNWGGESQ